MDSPFGGRKPGTCPIIAIRKVSPEPNAVALLTRLAGKPAVIGAEHPGLTWTALDVGGPCIEAFGMISETLP